jgi:hypothetical protein
MSDLDQLLRKIEQAESTIQKSGNWHPEQQGSIDIRIAVDGSWYHEGRAFQRPALVKLFASVLRKEETGYYLVTPVEKLAIQVDDAPFVACLLEQVINDRRQALVFTTNLGEQVVADDRHPIRVDIDPVSKEPRPYILVRDQLEALIGRNAFYEMLNLAVASERKGKQVLTINSMDTEFLLGTTDNPEQNK